MSGKAEFRIGAAVYCQDGECGELRRIVIDADTDDVTHLVVEPKQRSGKGRLVPIDLVEATTAHNIRLRCTLARFETLDDAEGTRVTPGFVAGSTATGLYMFRMRGTAGIGLHGPITIKPHAVTEDNLQAGEGEVSHGQPVHALDGPIGHVYGLVVDPIGELSHVLLGEGHLWGKKEVAIPISAVKAVVDDGVYLNLTKKQVGDLPPVDLERIG
jgi:sporulation protein YlmC with PRC-barrel domain